MLRRIVLAMALVAHSAATALAADELLAPIRPYDRIQAGVDAWHASEARRLDAINRQLGWNELLQWQAATQRSSSIFYDPYIPGFDYAYRLGPSAAGYGWQPSALDFRPIWGYGYFEAIRQPIGRREVQTGPNRWESFPIYADDVTPRAVESIVPAEPAEPAAPPVRGREF